MPFATPIPYDAGTDSAYSFDSTKIELVGGSARLRSLVDQTDDANDASGFGGGSPSGVAWDSSNGYVRLSQVGTPTNTAALDSSWTPKWGNLVGYWKFENNWNDSKGSNNATPSITGFTTNSKVGSYSTNPGSGASVASNPALNFANKLTIAFWIYPTARGTYYAAHPLGKSSSTSDANFSIYYFGDYGGVYPGQLGLLLPYANCGGSWGPISAGFFPQLNVWTHVALSYDSTLGGQLYVNGIALGSRTGSGVLATNTAPLVFDSTDVSLDEVAIWNSDLSATEVQLLYSRQSARYSGTLTSRVMDALSTGQRWTTLSWVPTLPFFKELPDFASGAIQNESAVDYSSLVGSTGTVGDNNLMNGIVGLWHLDEAAGTSAAGSVLDTSGKGNHLTPNGGTTFGTPGKLNSAAILDGSTGYLNIASTNSLVITGDMTMSAWVKRARSGTREIFFGKGDGNSAADGAYWLEFSADDSVSFYLGSNCTVNSMLSSQIKVSDTNWHLITATLSGSQKRIYVDGIADPRIQPFTGPICNTTTSLSLGRLGGLAAIYFQGSMDEAALWSRALDPKEVLQLYRRGANRIKHQVRICTASDCSDDATGANWKGPDGTNQTYFSELNNMTVQAAVSSGTVQKGLPTLLFSSFTNPVGTSRYFQYRTILESDDTGTGCNYGAGATWCSPELKSVHVGPDRYDSHQPMIRTQNPVSFGKIEAILETLGQNGCSGGVRYTFSLDKTVWYYWDGAQWAISDGSYAQSSSLASSTPDFSMYTSAGRANLYVQAFLNSDGAHPCELDQLMISGQN